MQKILPNYRDGGVDWNTSLTPGKQGLKKRKENLSPPHIFYLLHNLGRWMSRAKQNCKKGGDTKCLREKKTEEIWFLKSNQQVFILK